PCHEASLLVYGPNNPFSFVSGGTPEALRELKPEDIRKFHAENYHLGNMGMIASLPKEMALGDVLKRCDAILNQLEPDAAKRTFKTLKDIPSGHMAAAGSIKIIEYPDRNEQQPGPLMFIWPSGLELNNQERFLLSLFLANIAS